jgi:AraC family transcriptional regulator, alkane utilization regulator
VDVLSDVLTSLRPRSTVFAMTELAAPWGMRSEPNDHAAFHVLLAGRCWLEVDGRAPVEANAGDVLLLAPGHGHILRDAPTSRAIPLRELRESGAFDRRIDASAGAAVTRIVCGCFEFEDQRGALVVGALPPVVHLKEVGADVGPWLSHTIRLVSYESSVERPGAQMVVNRLCDALFVYVLRAVLADAPVGRASWLRGVADDKIGASMRAMHERPAEAWSVATLATRARMSRSAFAARFLELVGETPMQYLTRWRLRRAADLIVTGDAGLAEIAARVGYESEAAFHKAFKREYGLGPGAYRKTRRAGDPEIPAFS